MNKKCSKCEKTVNIKDFAKDKSRKDGLRNCCKYCAQKQQQEWYYKNHDKAKESARIQMQKKREAARKEEYNTWRRLKRSKKFKEASPLEKYKLAQEINYNPCQADFYIETCGKRGCSEEVFIICAETGEKIGDLDENTFIKYAKEKGGIKQAKAEKERKEKEWKKIEEKRDRQYQKLYRSFYKYVCKNNAYSNSIKYLDFYFRNVRIRLQPFEEVEENHIETIKKRLGGEYLQNGYKYIRSDYHYRNGYPLFGHNWSSLYKIWRQEIKEKEAIGKYKNLELPQIELKIKNTTQRIKSLLNDKQPKGIDTKSYVRIKSTRKQRLYYLRNKIKAARNGATKLEAQDFIYWKGFVLSNKDKVLRNLEILESYIKEGIEDLYEYEKIKMEKYKIGQGEQEFFHNLSFAYGLT